MGLADGGFGKGFVDEGLGDEDFGDAEAVGDFEEVDGAAAEEGAGEALGAVAVGVYDDVGPDAFEDFAVDVADGFGDDVGDAEFFTAGGGHDAAFEVAADGDDNGVAFLEAGFFEGAHVGGVAFDGFGDVFGELADLFAVGVDEEDFYAFFGEALDECFAKASCPDDSDTVSLHAAVLGVQKERIRVHPPFCLQRV